MANRISWFYYDGSQLEQMQAMTQGQQMQMDQYGGLGALFGALGGAGSVGNAFSAAIYPTSITPTPKERTMFQEVKNDVTTFIKEHRGVIYFIALALLIDHFIFKGVFKARLQGMLESLIGKVEAKVAAS